MGTMQCVPLYISAVGRSPGNLYMILAGRGMYKTEHKNRVQNPQMALHSLFRCGYSLTVKSIGMDVR